jgi:hypothetical protein
MSVVVAIFAFRFVVYYALSKANAIHDQTMTIMAFDAMDAVFDPNQRPQEPE